MKQLTKSRLVTFTIGMFMLASCDDHGFDWEKAKSENVEYQFEQNFQKLYGSVDPSQSWDFSEGSITTEPTNFTLADGTVINVTSNEGATTRAVTADYWTPSWVVTEKADYYEIPSSTLSWFKSTLTEAKNQKDNTDLGSSFALYVPNGEFTITPMYQGQAGMTWSLDIYFYEPKSGTTTSHVAKTVWKKFQNMQVKKEGSNNWTDFTSGDTRSVSGIRSNSLHFSGVPAGTVVIFGLYIDNGSGYAATGTTQFSNTNMMRALNVPADKTPTTYPIDFKALGKGENNLTIIGIEDNDVETGSKKSDWDYNDVVFLVNGLIPESVSDNVIPNTITKRYMVEDMGYSDKSSQAVINGYTDIDFNDIVVDFSKTVNTKYYYRNGQVERTEIVGTDYSAKVVALGGTWDFKLYVGNNVVFQKSDADRYIDYNSNYKLAGGAGVAISSIDVATMYNTNRATDQHGDGNYNTAYKSVSGYLGTLKNTNNKLNNWDPDKHNISFEIVDDTKYGAGFNGLYNSTTDKGNVYTISFPTMGAVPKIAAFPDTKVWNAERVAVDKNFFSTSATWE